MAYHNATCGCAECRNYGQPYNPNAIHNQSCGCERCGNYPKTSPVVSKVVLSTSVVAAPVAVATDPKPDVEMVAVPADLLEEVRALIAKRQCA